MDFTFYIPKHRQRKLSDTEIVIGLQCHDTKVEKCFFDTFYSYFNKHFSEFFFDKDSKQEVFQSAIIKLWTEIENKTIRVIDNHIYRRQKTAQYQVISASLTTFLMAFAKNEFRELLRNSKDDNIDEVLLPVETHMHTIEEDETEEKIRIVDECIQTMSPNCIEIITLFYHQQKSLDEILQIRNEKNSSKDGLKTAKNKCMVTLRQRVNDRLKLA